MDCTVTYDLTKNAQAQVIVPIYRFFGQQFPDFHLYTTVAESQAQLTESLRGVLDPADRLASHQIEHVAPVTADQRVRRESLGAHQVLDQQVRLGVPHADGAPEHVGRQVGGRQPLESGPRPRRRHRTDVIRRGSGVGKRDAAVRRQDIYSTRVRRFGIDMRPGRVTLRNRTGSTSKRARRESRWNTRDAPQTETVTFAGSENGLSEYSLVITLAFRPRFDNATRDNHRTTNNEIT